MTLFRKKVVDAVAAAGASGVATGRLERELGVTDEAGRQRLRELLGEAEDKGEIATTANRRWVAIEHTDLWVGTLRVTARGFGILRQEGDQGDPIVVPPERLATALDGDRVLVRRGSRRRRGRTEPERYGDVVRVIARRRQTLVGRFRSDRRQAWVEPYARRLGFKVLLSAVAGEAPREGEFVEVAVDTMPATGPVAGRLLRRLGAAGESGVDEEVVLADLGVPVDFPTDALAEAEGLPDAVGPEEPKERTDLRDQPAVTIDGETAKDFDDAVVARPAADGAIEVWVHIADVSHYVRPGTPLDRAARERGTSVYLPGRAIPMLPERLSNHLCSLVAGEDRLAFSVRFLVTRNGGLEGYRAERVVFRSRRRCTYGEVFEWLELGSWPGDLAPGVKESLLLLDEAAARLRARRQERGAIDFDLPEPEILLDPDGFMTGIQAVERTRAHRLIEELMLAANECVARLMVWGKQPGMFRVHERPSPGKLAELQSVLEEFDTALKGDLEKLPPRELQRVLAAIEGRDEERFLQTLILRALARAAYDAECRGHYALATDFYLHFTSPIRRYPDLLVHRFLGELTEGRRRTGAARELAQAELEELAPHCSFTERRADEAEREVVKWKQAEYMRAHLGEEFTGHVTGVVAFGLFVQLDQVYVEGLIHVSDLGGDYYVYDETGHRLVGSRTGRTFRLGDGVRVRATAIDEDSMEVDLELLGGGTAGSPAGPPRQRPLPGRGEAESRRPRAPGGRPARNGSAPRGVRSRGPAPARKGKRRR